MMRLYGGIDIGSTTSEFIIVDETGSIIYKDRTLTSGNIKVASETVYNNFKNSELGNMDLHGIVATGYGRKYVPYVDRNITEITCYAKGAKFVHPAVKTIVDIGGQDSKVITVNDGGDVDEFVMNDKCAAGTGRFLDLVAKIFNIDVDELGEYSEKSDKVIPISTVCAVFAESEIISLISQQVSAENIIRSIHNSIAEKIRGMAGRLQAKEDIMFCGGVARNKGMVKAIGQLFNSDNIIVPKESDFIGAMGAALFAAGL
jgi:predicted CoA-substrate-specific enzyme activase